VDWISVFEFVVALLAGGLINWWFSRQSSKELVREPEKLRRLVVTLTQILDGQGIIEVKEWDPETGEPKKWSVGTSREIQWAVEAPTPRWRRVWRRFFGG